MWFMVCCWPQSQEGDWARPYLCKLGIHFTVPLNSAVRRWCRGLSRRCWISPQQCYLHCLRTSRHVAMSLSACLSLCLWLCQLQVIVWLAATCLTGVTVILQSVCLSVYLSVTLTSTFKQYVIVIVRWNPPNNAQDNRWVKRKFTLWNCRHPLCWISLLAWLPVVCVWNFKGVNILNRD